jgi:DNA mismatch repair ATPase MutS
MAINHDLTYYPDWLVANVEGGFKFVLFLCLQNRFEVFDKDAELLEKEFDVQISRIHPRDCEDLSFTIPACRIPANEAADLFRRLIKNGYKVAVVESLPVTETESAKLKSKQLDFF